MPSRTETNSKQYTKLNCGELRAADAGTLRPAQRLGHRRRDQGALIFIDLRDRWGITQIVFNREINPDAHKVAEEARAEYVLRVEGIVQERGADRVNPNLATGEIEVAADNVTILNRAKPMPFEIAGGPEADEMLRLKYRYLDLRRTAMQRNLALRHGLSSSSATTWTRATSLRSKLPSSSRAPRKARATTWCRAGSTRASSTPCRNRPSN